MIVVFDHFCFDVTMLAILYLCVADFYDAIGVFLIPFLLGSAAKAFVQDNGLTFHQPHGYNWYFPGAYSVMVPYHDMSDLYFSGHI